MFIIVAFSVFNLVIISAMFIFIKRSFSEFASLSPAGRTLILNRIKELESRLESVENNYKVLSGDVEKIFIKLKHAFQGSGIIRYDAFDNISGMYSFSYALLDANKNGIIITSIMSRDFTRVYAKEVSNGNVNLEISPEEKKALEIAISKIN
ncbi:DUF4446 family protein [Thermodesulfobium acidiphilum]|uniref:DUF4446 family protein n=1 Tax=Thermodesulfobium acidiphilum TaxID=1794699 RepID=UPI0019029861|nr:DUF4446 family protein [Thermodesulfobium acidiphilum]